MGTAWTGAACGASCSPAGSCSRPRPTAASSEWTSPTAQGLYILNDSLNFGGEYHARFTYLLTAGGTAPVRGTQHALPTNLVYTGTGVVPPAVSR